jgi:hypothetical protein
MNPIHEQQNRLKEDIVSSANELLIKCRELDGVIAVPGYTDEVKGIWNFVRSHTPNGTLSRKIQARIEGSRVVLSAVSKLTQAEANALGIAKLMARDGVIDGEFPGKAPHAPVQLPAVCSLSWRQRLAALFTGRLNLTAHVVSQNFVPSVVCLTHRDAPTPLRDPVKFRSSTA